MKGWRSWPWRQNMIAVAIVIGFFALWARSPLLQALLPLG